MLVSKLGTAAMLEFNQVVLELVERGSLDHRA